jgi:hypothetical protein
VNPGVEWLTIETSVGFWRPENSSIFIRCLLPEHCDGSAGALSTSTNCGRNRVGPICALCDEGFHAATLDQHCEKCPDQSSSVWLTLLWASLGLAGLAALYGVVLRNTPKAVYQGQGKGVDFNEGVYPERQPTQVLTKEDRARSTVTFNLKILVSFFQISGSLSSVVDTPWPGGFLTFMGWFEFLNFNFIPWQSVECVASFDYYTKFLVVSLVPLVILGIISIAVLIPLCWLDRTDMSDEEEKRLKRQSLRQKYSRLVLFTLFLLYPGVSSSILSMFVCEKVNGHFYLMQDFTLECGDERWLQY